VIHFLLETALREPGCDLADLARAALEEQGLAVSRAAEALGVVASVGKSVIWWRAGLAERRLVEAPFAICSLLPIRRPACRPRYQHPRVSIRLVEAKVIVDWKTVRPVIRGAGRARAPPRRRSPRRDLGGSPATGCEADFTWRRAT
jgi:hypothetical protein